MSTDPGYPTNNYANGSTDTNNDNGPSVLWKLPTYVAAAKVVVCNEEFRASTRRHKTWRRNAYPVGNHNCGINSPERETTETSDDLHGKSERMEAGSDKESYATSTIQVVSTNTFVDLKILHLLILHSFLKEQGDFLYSGQFLEQVDRYGCTLSLFNIHAILG